MPDDVERVQEQRQPRRVDAFVYREERGVGQVFAADLGGDVEAANSGEPCGALDLLHGESRLLHRQCGEPDEAAGMALVRASERVVVGLGEAPREIAFAPVDHRLRQRQGVHAHALLVHRRQTRVQIDELRADRPGGHVPVLELRALALHHLVLEAVGRAVLFHQIEKRLRKIVGVNIDGTARTIVGHRYSIFSEILPCVRGLHL